MITTRHHIGGRDVLLLPVSAPLVGGLADPSTSNTGKEAKPRPTGCRKPRYRSSTATVDLTPDIHRRATLLVTAVDDLFGTHRLVEPVLLL